MSYTQMRMAKKLSYLAAGVALSATLLVGCSKGNETEKPTETPSTGSETTEAPKEKLSFTYMGSIWDPFPQEKTDVMRELEKRTNTDITFDWYPTANFDEKVTVTLASGKLPDMIYGANLSTLIDQGAIIPLDDLLEEHGQNILAALTEEDLNMIRNAQDGKIYNIPFVLDFPAQYAMQLRTDWLDRVGIEKTPETWEEWKAAWTAFKEQDANGDGNPNNEVPFGGDVYSLMPAFGLNIRDKNCFLVDGTGNYTMAYELPEFKLFLEEVRGLYANGLLDQEFSTRGLFVNNVEVEKAYQANIVGSGMNWAANTKTTTNVLREIDPLATLVGVKPVQGPEGHSGIVSRTKAGGSAAITVAGEEKAVEIIKFFDYLFSEEGTTLASYGIEGQHYDLVDGKPVLKDEFADFNEARKNGVNFTPFPHVFTGDSYMQMTLGGKTVEELDETTKIFYDALFVGEDSVFAPTPTLQTGAYIDNQATIMPKLESL
ncbi:MAG: extracellular solute-binding protein, partial [Turicibacter sp.]